MQTMNDHQLTAAMHNPNIIRVKSGLFRQTAKLAQRPLFVSYFKYLIKNKLTKQTVNVLLRLLLRSRLIWIYTVCKCVSEFT